MCVLELLQIFWCRTDLRTPSHTFKPSCAAVEPPAGKQPQNRKTDERSSYLQERHHTHTTEADDESV